MKLRNLLIILGITVATLPTLAQESSSASTVTIADRIESAGNIKVVMPRNLEKRLQTRPEKLPEKAETTESVAESTPESKAPATAHSSKMGGYRIQVFSDNNARTAKGEARARAKNISTRFPQYQTYVVYNSPYWRLRVGNFRTQDEANAAAHELKDAFPSYSREIRVVKDRIILEAN